MLKYIKQETFYRVWPYTLFVCAVCCDFVFDLSVVSCTNRLAEEERDGCLAYSICLRFSALAYTMCLFLLAPCVRFYL